MYQQEMCWGHFEFSKTPSQLPGVNVLFQSRLLLSLEHGWSWDTMTIKTHVPAYKEPCRPYITLFNPVLIRWHWDSLLDFIQVRLKLHTLGFLSSECLWESSLHTCIGQLGTLVCNYTAHFCLHIVHSLELNQLATLLLSSTDRCANSMYMYMCIQCTCRTGINLKSHKGILPCLPHFYVPMFCLYWAPCKFCGPLPLICKP